MYNYIYKINTVEGKEYKIRKLINIIILFIIFLFVTKSITPYFFQEVKKATPEVFKVTVRNLSVYSRKNKNWTLVQKKPMEIDIATKNEKVLDKIINNVPVGKYGKIKYSVCATFKMKGYVKYKNNTYYTSEKAGNGSNISEEFNEENPPEDYSQAYLTVFGYNEGEYFEPMEEKIKFKVGRGKIKNISVEVNVEDSLALYQIRADPDVYQLIPAQPKIRIFKYKFSP